MEELLRPDPTVEFDLDKIHHFEMPMLRGDCFGNEEFMKVVPEDVLPTSSSILFARYKGDLEGQARGAAALSEIRDGDRILISEGCTHHRQCNDIGTVKLPGWIRAYTGKEPEFCFTSGTEFPEDLSPYKLVVHCGGCMLNEREMQHRLAQAARQQVPMTNYGILIAMMKGILRRSVRVFPELSDSLGDL